MPLANGGRAAIASSGRAPWQMRAIFPPLASLVALAAVAFVPRVRDEGRLLESVIGAAAVLVVGYVWLFTSAMRAQRALTIEVALRKQHYLQACAQASILSYWGWYWPEVYSHAPLIVAQLAFAYGCDMLLSWSRRDAYSLGFGPFPVIFSMNLFMWFKPEWFYFQFAMVALGFAAKEFIRWNKDGRQAHIFNPSSFPLAIVSLVLIASHTTHITWGAEIAETQFRPPYIYLLIFLVGLPGQLLFGVTSMTMSAVVTMYVFGVVYHAITGTYFFFETIPIAVFLGMHLLFTDPSTSPRTEGGRVVFGVLYALSVAALAPWLGFYDKLLPVPVLNLLIKRIDALAQSRWLAQFDPAKIAASLAPARRRVAWVSVWTLFFIAISSTHGIGHTSRGYWLPEWQQACRDGRTNACAKLAELEGTYCRDGESGWACNDLGLLFVEGKYGSADNAPSTFKRSCDLGFTPGCRNLAALANGERTLQRGAPRPSDYAVLLVEGQTRTDEAPLALFRRACEQGWMNGCESLALMYLEGQGTARDPERAAREFAKACASGIPTACGSLAYQHARGDGVARSETRSLVYLKRSCDLGLSNACDWLTQACAAAPAGTDLSPCAR